MYTIKNIAVHHFGANNPNQSTKHLSEDVINTTHKNRWPDFPSELNGSYIGYNFIIYPDGMLKQYRLVGEETAANRGYNTNTVSICLAGNFKKGVDIPTFEQKTRLKTLIGALLSGLSYDHIKVKPGTVFALSGGIIGPHRKFQASTDCYGTGLSDFWVQELLGEDVPEIERLKKLILVLEERLYSLMSQLFQRKKLVVAENSCQDGRC